MIAIAVAVYTVDHVFFAGSLVMAGGVIIVGRMAKGFLGIRRCEKAGGTAGATATFSEADLALGIVNQLAGVLQS